jgi:hypothetical protein
MMHHAATPLDKSLVHVCPLGGTALGKSRLLHPLARELCEHGQAMVLFDPHGELTEARALITGNAPDAGTRP